MTKKDNALRMRKLVMEFRLSGRSQKEFASAHGIKEGKFHYWISKLSRPTDVPADKAPSNFVPIEVVPIGDGRTILIRCKNGVEIEIPV